MLVKNVIVRLDLQNLFPPILYSDILGVYVFITNYSQLHNCQKTFFQQILFFPLFL